MKDKTHYLLDIGLAVIAGISLLIMTFNTLILGKEFQTLPALIFGIVGVGAAIRITNILKKSRIE